MQGAPKRQVNAEEMLAELKRALESSTRAPNPPPPSASTAAKSSSPGRENWRSQIDKGSDRPAKANVGKSIGRRTDLQKSARPGSRSWKLIAGGLALAGAAAIWVSFAFMDKAPDLTEREPSVAATESLVRPHNEQMLEPSSSPARRPRHLAASPQPEPTRHAGDLARIRPDGTLIPRAVHSRFARIQPRPLAEAPKTAAPSAASQAIRPDGLPIATAPSTPASARFSAASG